MKFLKTHLVKFLKYILFEKPFENAYDLSKFLAPTLCSQVLMSAAKSLGSHQLNSFAAFLEEKLHTSSENSIVQIPQLKKMADGKKPQKGERGLRSTLPLKYLRTSMLGTAHPLRKIKISARCAFKRLRGDGQESGGSIDMLLPNT